MSRYVDLSGPLFNGMWTYNVLPGLDTPMPEYEVDKVITIDQSGFESFRFVLGSNCGTYLETSAHLIEGAPVLDDCHLSDFIRPAVVCHVPRKEARQLIRRSELEAHCPPVGEGDALLIDCGWGSQWRSPAYVSDGPGYHPDAMRWLVEQPFSLLGVDIPCLQPPWASPDIGYDGNMLRPILEKGVLLLAPLVNLDQVTVARGELIALPVKAEGVCGAPCRAIFRENRA